MTGTSSAYSPIHGAFVNFDTYFLAFHKSHPSTLACVFLPALRVWELSKRTLGKCKNHETFPKGFA